jgi:pimeloyl-ACP methyl ester carboxylesterase
MMLMPRLTSLEEIAASVAYLASDEARFVTGEALSIDGGSGPEKGALMATTRYVKSSGVSLAYQIHGEGEPTLLCVPGALAHLALDEAIPGFARFLERLTRFSRVVRFDKRGTALSDRSSTPLTVADQVPDVEAVREASGAERIALYGLSQGVPVAILYALAHPERVSHLILGEGVCCDRWNPDDAVGDERPLLDWDHFFARICVPDATDEDLSAVTEYLRATASPSAFESLWRGIVDLDLRPRLAEIDIPTLVFHAKGDRHHPVEHGHFLAEHMPNARLLELDSDAHVPIFDEAVADTIPAAIEELLTGEVSHAAQRRFATLLFTDIVGSTAEQQKRGDEAFRSVLQLHAADATRIVEQFGGRVVEFRGDGTLAEFSVPGEALRAARALGLATHERGLQIRAGLHAGEVHEADERLFGDLPQHGRARDGQGGRRRGAHDRGREEPRRGYGTRVRGRRRVRTQGDRHAQAGTSGPVRAGEIDGIHADAVARFFREKVPGGDAPLPFGINPGCLGDRRRPVPRS